MIHLASRWSRCTALVLAVLVTVALSGSGGFAAPVPSQTSCGASAAQATEQVKTREVTKYRQVPVKVEKERTVTQYRKGSVWEALFGSED